MKHSLRRFIAVSAAALTMISALPVAGLKASAYGLPDCSSNGELDLTKHQYNTAYNWMSRYEKNCFNYIWSTSAYQNVYPSYMSSDLDGLSSYTATIAQNTHLGWGKNTQIFCTLASEIATISDLNKTKIYTDKFNICKRISEKKVQPLSAVLEYDEDASANRFAIRLLDNYYTGQLLDSMRLEDYTFNDYSGKYSGKIVLYDHYIAGMEISSSDIWTTFGEPVIVEDDGFIQTEIPFEGTLPSPNCPDYDVYKKIMTYEEFREAVWCATYADYPQLLWQYDGHILTDLTVTFNGCGNAPYTTNSFKLYPQIAMPTGR